MSPSPDSNGYPDNPFVLRFWRGGAVESVHRGTWCLVDSQGTVLDGAGNWDEPFYVRSSIKSLQAIPLCETGAAERFAFRDEELALAMASHDGEPCHVLTVAATLERLGLSEVDLRCGEHTLGCRQRLEMERQGETPSQLHNNCSGKHTGFLALAKHLGVPLAQYLDPESESQRLVRRAIGELTDTPEGELVPGIDGCSAPTYRIPLRRVAMAFARVANPDGLETERGRIVTRMTSAAAAHPELIGGTRKRLDTDILRATSGRLFPKIGAEAIYAIGVRGADRGLAVKVDDGQRRGLHPLVVGLIRHLGLAEAGELDALSDWGDPVLRNHAGLEVGRIEPLLG